MSSTCNTGAFPIPLDSNAAPYLLVSVRDASEAVSALNGGADVVDIKDPEQGPLGRASSERMREIATACSSQLKHTTLSAALGEAVEFEHGLAVRLPEEISLAKMGLSDLADNRDWRSLWTDAMASVDSHRSSPLKWVAVAYADEDAANAPSWRDILDCVLANSSICGMLFDTWSKSSGSLLDFRTSDELAEAAERLRATNRFLAVAGRLKISDLGQIGHSDFDIFAVRSAACINFDRRLSVETSRVRQLKNDLNTMSHAS